MYNLYKYWLCSSTPPKESGTWTLTLVQGGQQMVECEFISSWTTRQWRKKNLGFIEIISMVHIFFNILNAFLKVKELLSHFFINIIHWTPNCLWIMLETASWTQTSPHKLILQIRTYLFSLSSIWSSHSCVYPDVKAWE